MKGDDTRTHEEQQQCILLPLPMLSAALAPGRGLTFSSSAGLQVPPSETLPLPLCREGFQNASVLPGSCPFLFNYRNYVVNVLGRES